MSNPISWSGFSIKSQDSVHISAKPSGIDSVAAVLISRFSFYHSEKVPSAAERYVNEVKRVCGVLEKHLSDPQNNGWLACGRYTIADLGFVAWMNLVEKLPISLASEFPVVDKWLKTMLARPAVIAGYKGGPYEIKN